MVIEELDIVRPLERCIDPLPKTIHLDDISIRDLDGVDPLPKTIHLDDISIRDPCRQMSLCLSMQELAVRLGYITTRQLVNADTEGRYTLPRSVWSASSSIRAPRDVWEAFLRRKQCLRCEKEENDVSRCKPFCMGCWRKIKQEDDEESDTWEEATITDQLKRDL